MNENSGPSAPTLMRMPAVLAATGLSRTAVYLAESQGKFPKRVKVGVTSAWVASEVYAWVASRIAERDAAQGKAA